ncbi:hypothetical protein D9V32_00860 [Mycetocola tolaasinivorans]|uniref:LPXTG cell wall anchor domain-containing protein n=1 Tax=Mycetocola tolaasinivorans TaxID=76635 RepID=A0A3L7AD21_9MICO|nr:hypothetical protein D9V32_00860 [Mycetocola tolaasinivorans]
MPNIFGWPGNAFGQFGFLTLSTGDKTWRFAADSREVETRAGDKTEVILRGNSGDSLDSAYAVTLTLTLEGNYVRWSYNIDGDNIDALTTTFSGSLNSNADTVVEPNGNTLLTYSSSQSNLASIITGVSVTSNGTPSTITAPVNLISNTLDFSSSTTGARHLAVTALAVDFPNIFPSSLDAALAFTRPLLASVDSHFGESHRTPGAPFSLTDTAVVEGETVDQEVKVTFSEDVASSPYFGLIELPTKLHVSGLPEGLSLSATFAEPKPLEEESEAEEPGDTNSETSELGEEKPDENASDPDAADPFTLHLSGSATAPGVYTVPVTVYLVLPEESSAFRGEGSSTDSHIPDVLAQNLVDAAEEAPFSRPEGALPLDASVTITVRAKERASSPSPTATEPTTSTPEPSNTTPTSSSTPEPSNTTPTSSSTPEPSNTTPTTSSPDPSSTPGNPTQTASATPTDGSVPPTDGSATPTDGSVPPNTASPGNTAGSGDGQGSDLPDTGANGGGLLLPISVLVALGGILYIGARRRRAVS